LSNLLSQYLGGVLVDAREELIGICDLLIAGTALASQWVLVTGNINQTIVQ